MNTPEATVPGAQDLAWRKSSYSGSTVNCVECASAAWHTSSYSSGANNCLQAATLPTSTTVAVRDSKHPHLPHLTFPVPAWTALLGAVRTGEL